MDKIQGRSELLKIKRRGAELISEFWRAKTEEERQKVLDEHDVLLKELDDLELQCFGSITK